MMFVRGRDKGYDIRRFRLNFADIWPQRVANILSGLVTSDPVPFGWCIEHDGVPPTEGGNGDPIRVKPRKWFGTQAELDEYYDNLRDYYDEDLEDEMTQIDARLFFLRGRATAKFFASSTSTSRGGRG